MSESKKNVLVLLGLVCSLWAVSIAQDIPADVSPYVRLGHRVKVTVYRNPEFDADSQTLTKRGELVEERVVDIPVGSGTIISADGLILTNFHVYNLSDTVNFNRGQNRLYVQRRIRREMLVYRLKDNDPLREPVLQYQALPVSLDEIHDTALLRIVTDGEGNRITPSELTYCRFSNPYDMRLNQKMTILGYPAKGGDTITITEGKFLGYYRSKKFMGLDGFIKTDAAMSPGNSGGAAMDKVGIIGVPTAVTPPDLAGSDLGYVHPITWSAKTLTVARQKFGHEVQDLPVEWLRAPYNTDETRNNVYVTGVIRSAESLRPLLAEVLIARPDRALEDIRSLHRELLGIVKIYNIKRLFSEGVGEDGIAQQLRLSQEEVKQGIEVDLKNLQVSNDAYRYTQGEFFYKLGSTDKEGFFIIGVPRGIAVKLYAYNQEFRMMVREFNSGEGVSQNLGKINLFGY